MRLRRQVFVLSFFILALCRSSVARAQSPIGREFQAHAEASGTQNLPDLAFDQNGGLVVAWTDFDQDPAFSDFNRARASVYSKAGLLTGEYLLVDTSDTPHAGLFYPLVVSEPNGDFTLFYSRGQLKGGALFFGQKFSANGVSQGKKFLISTDPPGNAYSSAVAKLPTGGYFAVSIDDSCSACSAPLFVIYARLLDAMGAPLGPYFRVDRDQRSGNGRGARNVAVDSTGNAVVVWYRQRLTGQEDVWGQRFMATGARLGKEFLVNSTTRGSQASPSVAADPWGNFTVVWQSRREEGGPQQILAQRFSKTSQKIGPEFRVNSDPQEKDFDPSIATDRFGNFVVVWESFSLSSPVPTCTDIKGRLYRKDGTPVGPDFFLSADPRPCEEFPRVAFGPNGIFAAAWDRFNGANDDVYAARFSASPGDEPCLVRGSRVLCDTGRTGGEPEIELSFGGRPGEVILLGDFDGDGRDDVCARFGTRFRCDLDHRGNPSEGQIVSFGLASDTPLLGDINGDGKADPCVRRGDQFLCDTKRDGGAADMVIRFGTASDVPLLGDLDGDGRDDPCVFRSGTFLCDLDHRGGAAEAVISFGAAGDQPALGDLDGDGRDDPCVLSGGHLRCDTAHDGGSAEVDLALNIEPGDRLLIGNLDGL